MPTRPRRMLTMLLLLGLLWCPFRGWAEARQQQGRAPIVMLGIGEQPCSAWTSAVTKHKHTPMGALPLPTLTRVMSYTSWMQGFLTAISHTVPGASDLHDPSKIFAKMDEHCKRFPRSPIALTAFMTIHQRYSATQSQ